MSKIMYDLVDFLGAKSINFEVIANIPLELLTLPPVLLRKCETIKNSRLIESIKIKGQLNAIETQVQYVNNKLTLIVRNGVRRYYAIKAINMIYGYNMQISCRISNKFNENTTITSNIVKS